MAVYNKTIVIHNQEQLGSHSLVEDIKRYLKGQSIHVVEHKFASHSKKYRPPPVDFAICIGGDGTALYSCRLLANQDIPILTINYGKFGFITEISPQDWQQELKKFLSGNYETENRILIDVDIMRDKRKIKRVRGLNDAVVSVAGISRLMHYMVYINHKLLAEYRADGLIVATPTGSTAYSVAAGGPILHPVLPALIVNPICPFSLSNRSLVIPDKQTVAIFPRYEAGIKTVLTIDGQDVTILRRDEYVVVKISKKYTKIVRSSSYSFYAALRQKLHWFGDSHVE